jgi:hypothetical protein
MSRFRRAIRTQALIAMASVSLIGSMGLAAEPVPLGPPLRPAIPAGLPEYRINARLDLDAKSVGAGQVVKFTNRSKVDVTELVFHVYPRFKIDPADIPALAKTLEVLRLSPDEALDAQGRRLAVSEVRIAGRSARFDFDPKIDTLMSVPLSAPLKPGKSIECEVDFTLSLPEKWGRWGHFRDVTYLMNWYPVLAFHDDGGWSRTPFVPWHQPWHQEASHYHVTFDLPADQVVASTGRITEQHASAPGRKLITIGGSPSRDFALACSNRFEVNQRRAGSTLVRVVSLPEHRDNAAYLLDAACEVIPQYEEWFGPYYDEEYEMAPGFFGWNGNECSGLVFIDDRVLRLPAAGRRYLEHLATHETCHQWFWNVVGTDGFRETFMDEGLVTCFTALRLDGKHGLNDPLIVWPSALNWLPTVGREDMRLSGYYGWRARGGTGSAIRDINAMGNLGNLFCLAYDRGGKVVQMVHNRLGPGRFFAFFQDIYRDYAYKTFSYADLKRELDEFDPEGHWPTFLDGWLVEHKDGDWSVSSVKTGLATQAGRDVTVRLTHDGEMLEPTVVMCRAGESEVRVPIWPEIDHYEVPGAKVDRDGKTWTIHLVAPGAPSQVIVDPDHALLDAVPDNNRWKPEVAWRVTPFMTPLDTAGQFQAYDKPSFVAGPFIDQYARGGFKAGFQRLEKWQVIGWAGVEPALNEAIFGGQATLFHLPGPKDAVGVFYEQGMYNFYNDKRHSGGRIFLRHRFLESSSFLADDQGFAEIYLGNGNEFWQGDDGRPVDGRLTAVGARFRLNTLFPFWDPVGGQLLDLTAEYGFKAFGSRYSYERVTAEYGIVRPLPEGLGYFSRSRLAFRAYGGVGFPDTEPYFRLGGGRRLRALDLSQDIGNAVWLITLEWRAPLWRNIDRDVLDHALSFRNLFGTVFYDVGQSFLAGKDLGVVSGIGVGLRLDTTLFSFLERATLRLDIAQPIGTGRGPILWMGLNQVF